MPTWPALLLAPVLALGEQSIVYALATPTCETQREAWLHAIPLAFLAATLACTALALAEVGRLRRAGQAQPHADADARRLRRYFVAWMAVATGAFSALVILALWVPQWVLSPCTA